MPSSKPNVWMPPLKRLGCPARRTRRVRRVGLEATENLMRKPRLGIVLLAAVLLAAAAIYAVPRAADAVAVLDDPGRIASRALDGRFDALTAQREIDAALAAQDIGLAQSIIDLARARQVTIDPALAEKVVAAAAEAA